jgi:hypothetical protein
MMIEAITLAALSARRLPSRLACSFFPVVIGDSYKMAARAGAAIWKRSVCFTTTQLQRGRVVHVFDCVSRVRAFVKISDLD